MLYLCLDVGSEQPEMKNDNSCAVQVANFRAVRNARQTQASNNYNV